MSLVRSEKWVGLNSVQNHVVSPYWEQRHNSKPFESPSTAASANLVREWEKYLSSSGVLTPTGEHTFLSERIVAREVLWMLRGIKEVFVFSWNGSAFVVNDNIQMQHVTQGTLKNFLAATCPYGSMIVHLQDFVSATVHASYHQLETTQTLQAFASSVSFLLRAYCEKLLALERILIDQEETLTLAMLIQELHPYLEGIANVHYIFKQAVLSSVGKTSAEQGICLLNLLERSLVDAEAAGQKLVMPQIVKLYLDTIKPYVDFVDKFISTGKLEDVYGEFLIKRAENMTLEDPRYWKDSFYISDQESFMFLSPLLESIISAGKSMEHLRFANHAAGSKMAGSLHKDIVSKLEASVTVQERVDVNSKSSGVEFENMETVAKDIVASLETTKSSKLVGFEFPAKVKAVCSVGQLNCALPTIQRVIEQLVKERCSAASAKFLGFFKLQSKLFESVETVHNHFLMLAGEVMDCFTAEVFSKLLSGTPEMWQNGPFLNFALQEALAWQACPIVGNLDIHLKDSAPKMWLDGFDNVVLRYSAAWPVTIVLTDASLKVYNRVFTLLCKVKCAKFALEELHFRSLEPTHAGSSKRLRQNAHALQLLKFQVFSFLNAFHDCLMKEALYGSKLAFDRDLRDAADLDTVIECHENFVAKIYEQCLLGEKFVAIQQVILALLKLCIKLHVLWNKGIEHIIGSQIKDIWDNFLMFHVKFRHVAECFISSGHCDTSRVLAFAANSPFLQAVKL
ncbi:hypothetical protein HPB47_006474 [Ixodes persulcatus]|uniref:Uncharacterized protein n=1 Tax=Ixodes persulcatus TaxID=34615 RepID=A0AC60PA68_IXOPE|nr:hypothetical protein HPB47_006474 [Ixodes persulcatus]